MVAFIYEGAGTDLIQVRIRHNLEMGYLPAADGKIILERMSLDEIISRIYRNRSGQYYDPNDSKDAAKLRDEIVSAVRSINKTRMDMFADYLDIEYASLIRERKIKLAQHNMAPSQYSQAIGMSPMQMGTSTASLSPSRYIPTSDPYMEERARIRDAERMALEQSGQIVKKRRDDIYYLLCK